MTTPRRCVLVTGNCNYSSWSLRAWLCLRKSGADFEVERLALDTEEFREVIARHSPTRQVPVLHHGDVSLWESLAIAEYANEVFANGTLWPTDVERRGVARSVAAEVHAGFHALRAQMPMNIRAVSRRVPATATLRRDIDRVVTVWNECRARNAALGPWLFGAFSIADAMYAPIATRLRTYGVELDGEALRYQSTVLTDADMAEWIGRALREPESIPREELGVTTA